MNDLQGGIDMSGMLSFLVALGATVAGIAVVALLLVGIIRRNRRVVAATAGALVLAVLAAGLNLHHYRSTYLAHPMEIIPEEGISLAAEDRQALIATSNFGRYPLGRLLAQEAIGDAYVLPPSASAALLASMPAGRVDDIDAIEHLELVRSDRCLNMLAPGGAVEAGGRRSGPIGGGHTVLDCINSEQAPSEILATRPHMLVLAGQYATRSDDGSRVRFEVYVRRDGAYRLAGGYHLPHIPRPALTYFVNPGYHYAVQERSRRWAEVQSNWIDALQAGHAGG